MSGGPDAMIVLIRHGPTEWNAVGRIQGQSDVSLSAAGRREVATWRIPQRFQQAQWVSSPLKRAVQTAAVMGCHAPVTEPLLMEMNWGEWEGHRLAELRNKFGAEMEANENRGLDFRPPGGESPRQVQQRIKSWLAQTAAARQTRIVITHKGVIRAAISLVTKWNMMQAPPFPLRWDCAQVLRLSEQGQAALYATNFPLTGELT